MKKKLALLSLAALAPTVIFAQVDPVADVTGAAATATSAFNAFVAITVTAFIVGMVVKYARKAVK